MIASDSRTHKWHRILGTALALFLITSSTLLAVDKNDAYNLDVKVKHYSGKTVLLEFTLTTSDSRNYNIPKSLDQLHLKFYGVDGGVVDQIMMSEVKLDMVTRTRVVWTVKIISPIPYGSVNANVLFKTGDGEVKVEGDAFISGYRMISKLSPGKPGEITMSISLTSSNSRSFPIPMTLDKARVKLFDKDGTLIAVANENDLILKGPKFQITRTAVMQIPVRAEIPFSYEVAVHIQPVRRTLILEDEGNNCYSYNCEQDTKAKIVPNQLNKSIAIIGDVKQFSSMPERYTLSAYPNPFNPSTTIQLGVPDGQVVNLIVYDVLGRHVSDLLRGEVVSGAVTIQWNGTDQLGHAVPTGTYFLRLTTSDYAKTIRLTMIK